MFHNSSCVNLYAHVLFSQHACGRFSLQELNVFDSSVKQWATNLENFDHFRNFHGCLITVEQFLTEYFYIMNLRNQIDILNHDYGQIADIFMFEDAQCGGVVYEIVTLASERANFTPHYAIIVHNKGFLRSRRFRPGTTPKLNMFYGLMFYDFDHFTVLPPDQTIDYYFLVTPNDLYTNYEKLVFPFDVATWLLLLFTFGVAFALIIGLRGRLKWMKILLVGRGEILNYKKLKIIEFR